MTQLLTIIFLTQLAFGFGARNNRMALQAKAKAQVQAHLQVQATEQAKAAEQVRAGDSEEERPIRKVITLIEEMKAQVEKDADADKIAFDKYMCWCKNNKREKSEALKDAEVKIGQLEALIAELIARAGSLKHKIAGLDDDITDDKGSVESATGIRTEEHDGFVGEIMDMKITMTLLEKAIAVLEKVQLLQKKGQPVKKENKEVHEVLLQVKDMVETRLPSNFRDTMQRDLYDVLGTFPIEEEEHGGSAALNQQPIAGGGQAAGAKSYNSRSGGILGIMKQMLAGFRKDMGMTEDEDERGGKEFSSLKGAKIGEIQVATGQQDRKEVNLADTLDDAARAREEKFSLEDSVKADQLFLSTMERNCAEEEELYKDRVVARNEEIRALAETLKILTDDDARDLYASTESFLQLGSHAQERAVQSAVSRIARVATKNKNWALAGLAVRMQLDAFTKVKKAMDNMLAELKSQQKDEYAKAESCRKSIDETEDSIKTANELKEDLAEKKISLADKIETLTGELEELQKDVSNMEISLKQAGEERKAQNEVFQQSVADQRATVNILKKAEDRMKQFYAFQQQEPPPRPSRTNKYEQNGSAGGVLQLLAKIISDAEVEEGELKRTEQKAQEDYAAFTKGATASIQADRQAITEREGDLAEAQSAKSDTSAAQLANEQDIEGLASLLAAHHGECDYVLKFFDMRQQARMEEMEAIKDAKAILSGAKFGDDE